MAVTILLRFTITCDTCKKVIAKFRAFTKSGEETLYLGAVICDKCYKSQQKGKKE